MQTTWFQVALVCANVLLASFLPALWRLSVRVAVHDEQILVIGRRVEETEKKGAEHGSAIATINNTLATILTKLEMVLAEMKRGPAAS
jgi:hypothetical protein